VYERLTVGRLDEAGRQRFHDEQKLAAELVLVPRESIPETVTDLRSYLRGVVEDGELRVTDAARRVATLFDDPPPEAEWRPVLGVVSNLAFATLPPAVREQYGFELTPARRIAVRATFAGLRAMRPLLPARYRYIAPYQDWLARRSGREGVLTERARRRAGIRLDGARSLEG
jgi:uncharacterized protein (DUF2236 family)